MAEILETKVKLELTSNELYNLAWILKTHLKDVIKNHYSKLSHPNPKQVFWEQEKDRFELCILFYELSGWGKGEARKIIETEINNTFKNSKKED